MKKNEFNIREGVTASMTLASARQLTFLFELYITLESNVSHEIVTSIATLLVGAQLDYCNAVYCGISCNNIDKLQRVQNVLTCVVKVRIYYDHVTPLHSELH